MQTDKIGLSSYYGARAGTYEDIYAKPERQQDLLAATHILQEKFRDRSVVEIACGTGYWTQKLALVAREVKASDISADVLDIAKSKEFPLGNVQFTQIDLFDLEPDTSVNALFGGFIWSHIKLEMLDRFVRRINALVPDGSLVVFMDNRFVEGSSTAIAGRDGHGNTYQRRNLKNGAEYLVLKNFPEQTALEKTLQGKCQSLEYIALEYFWIMAYQTAAPVSDPSRL